MARPNFVFILADDLGYADLHCYGGREDCSPNLDKMAAKVCFYERLRNSSVCSPSRFAIATGRYQHRLRGGFDDRLPALRPHWACPGTSDDGFPFARRGYSTALVGKWHLGSLPWFSPLKSGYDEFFDIAPEQQIFSHTPVSADTIFGKATRRYLERAT